MVLIQYVNTHTVFTTIRVAIGNGNRTPGFSIAIVNQNLTTVLPVTPVEHVAVHVCGAKRYCETAGVQTLRTPIKHCSWVHEDDSYRTQCSVRC